MSGPDPRNNAVVPRSTGFLLPALLAGLAGALLAPPAAAHVAPSEQENNRYVVLAPLGDRLRLVYIVYIGEQPGRQARARMDRDGDRLVDEGEAQAHADRVASEAAARLRLEIDDEVVPLRWSSVDIGLGHPAVTGGSFAIDLIATPCYERAGGGGGGAGEPARSGVREHTVRFTDRLQLPSPGESELRAEESPGVRIERAGFAGDPAAAAAAVGRPRLEHRWSGGPGPAAEGFEMAFAVDAAEATFPDAPCGGAAAGETEAPDRSHRGWLVGTAVVLGVAVLLGALVLRVRRRRARR